MSQNHQKLRLGVITSHPIQYQAPWFRDLAGHVELEVYFAHQPKKKEQGEGFGKAFEWDVDLLSGYNSRFLVNVSKRPGTSHYAGCDTPEIASQIADGGFDAFIVNGWYLKCYWQAVKACRRAGIPVLCRGDSQLMTPRSKIKEKIKEVVYRQMLKRFDGFLTVGQRNTEYLLHYRAPQECLFPAPHFVDNEWFGKRAAQEAGAVAKLREEWGVSNQELVILFSGKFVSVKRVQDLLSSLANLDSAAMYRLVLVGSGELQDSLLRQAQKLRVVPVFVGFKNQSELPIYYAAADVLILPSESETWGLVVNEAMACGIPAIVSEACGCSPDLIESGVTGFTFPTGNVVALAACISKMDVMKRAGHDWRPALRKKLSEYSVAACTRGTLQALHSLIEHRA